MEHVFRMKYEQIPKHSSLIKYSKGTFNLRPPVQKISSVWDVQIMFQYFTSLANNSQISSNNTGRKFSMKDFFNKCDEIRKFLRIWSHLLKKSLIENFIFCAVHLSQKLSILVLLLAWQRLNAAFYFAINRMIITSTNVAFSLEHVDISKRYSTWDPYF